MHLRVSSPSEQDKTKWCGLHTKIEDKIVEKSPVKSLKSPMYTE